VALLTRSLDPSLEFSACHDRVVRLLGDRDIALSFWGAPPGRRHVIPLNSRLQLKCPHDAVRIDRAVVPPSHPHISLDIGWSAWWEAAKKVWLSFAKLRRGQMHLVLSHGLRVAHPR